MKHRKPSQKLLVPLDNDRRRGIYIGQNKTAGHARTSYGSVPLTPRQRKRVRKSHNRALLRAKLAALAAETSVA